MRPPRSQGSNAFLGLCRYRRHACRGQITFRAPEADRVGLDPTPKTLGMSAWASTPGVGELPQADRAIAAVKAIINQKPTDRWRS